MKLNGIARLAVTLSATSIALSGSLLFAAPASGNAAAVVKMEVFPPDVNLNTKRDMQRYIVVATRADGVTLDVTKEAQIKLDDAKLVRLENAALYPVADGATTMHVSYGGHKCAIPVKVQDAAADRPISFKLDVMPVFMRSGCNTGSCHGAARGKDGFMLSLFGYDADGDHHRITHELANRRINLAVPEESLLLEKNDGSVPHTGGKRFDRTSPYYAAILEWLQTGAPKDEGDVAKVVQLELYPKQAVLQGAGATQQLIARAIYSDGTDRDVTNLAVFMTSNDNSAPMNPEGLATAANRGEAFMMARYDTITVGSQFLVMPTDMKYSPKPEKAVNYVDELVEAKLKKLRIEPSPLCSDETYLRRTTLDIVGLLPTEQEYREFMADKSADKRAKLVDRLLDRKEFSDIWAMKWAEVLMIRNDNNKVYPKGAALYFAWLSEKISQNVPIDQIVQQVVAANGAGFHNPASIYFQVETDLLKTAENTAQVFFGIRTQCAQCHNHPFDRWTMDDYYSFAAFFAQVGKKPGEDFRELVVYNRGTGETTNPVTKKPVKPRFLGGNTPEIQPGEDRRAVLANWLTSPENPYFSRNVANRIWDHFFGIGIINPVDDVRVSNPPTNPELLAELATKLIDYKYDFKKLIRDICASNAYQRSGERNPTNELDETNFSHSRVRRIQAESLLDVICQVTDTKEKFPRLALGSRAVQIADGNTVNYFLDTFGRSKRLTVCADDVNTDPSLSQSLHLLNGTTIENKVSGSSTNVIRAMLKEGKTPEQAIESLFIRCLTRKPTADEMKQLSALVKDPKVPENDLQDIFWAVLNSREFVFNH